MTLCTEALALQKLSDLSTCPIPALPELKKSFPNYPRYAAVLIVIDTTHSHLPVLFIVRSPTLSTHPHEIAFPGGIVSPSDTSIVETATREAYEELSLPTRSLEIMGCLQAQPTHVSETIIFPVISLCHKSWHIIPNPAEVESWFWVPLTSLIQCPHIIKRFQRDDTGDQFLHFYNVDRKIIWGATGGMVHSLLEYISQNNEPR